MNFYEKCRLAQDEGTSPEILEELSRDSDWAVRYCVADNASMPESVLIRLSKDRKLRVRDKAIRNKSFDGILKEIVKVILGEDGKIDWLKFGHNKISGKFNVGILTDWTEKYFNEIL